MQHIGKTRDKLRLLWDLFLDYIFPKECFGCQKEGEYLCSACFDKINYIDESICYLCHKKKQAKGICLDCQKKYGIDEILVITNYNENIVAQLVEELKYSFIEGVAEVLARVIDHKLRQTDQTSFLYNKILVPIPLHVKRFKERGFNQTSRIILFLQDKYNFKMDENLILRKKYTNQQAKLNRQERLSNVKDCFIFNLKREIPSEVVLFDDVLTTGATFIEATKILKSYGVKKICCLAVCHG